LRREGHAHSLAITPPAFSTDTEKTDPEDFPPIGGVTLVTRARRGGSSVAWRSGHRAGAYRLTLTAQDGAGNRSGPVRRRFTILPG
jgi:hypothetical protein